MTDVSVIEDTATQFTTVSEFRSSESYRIQVIELPTGGITYWRNLDTATLNQFNIGQNILFSTGQLTIERFELVFIPFANFVGDAGTFRGEFRSGPNISNPRVNFFDFDVSSVPDVPTGITISNATVAENVEGAGIGVLTAIDPDIGDFHSFQLVGDISGNFEIQSGTLRLRDGVSLDFEEQSLFTVRVRAIDSINRAVEQNIQIAVSDVIEVTLPETEVIGTSAPELFIAEEADDFIFGAGGNDTLIGSIGEDVLLGGAGEDTLRGNGGDDILRGGNDADLVEGGLGDDNIAGGLGADTLSGQANDDRLSGGGGNDLLRGGGGEDTILGGLGQDTLLGGSGEDIFLFRDAAESSADSKSDRIFDFEVGVDQIDLSTLVDGPFIFRGAAGFIQNGWASLTVRDNGSGTELVRIDVDGDRVTDMLIRVVDTTGLTADDFIL